MYVSEIIMSINSSKSIIKSVFIALTIAAMVSLQACSLFKKCDDCPKFSKKPADKEQNHPS